MSDDRAVTFDEVRRVCITRGSGSSKRGASFHGTRVSTSLPPRSTHIKIRIRHVFDVVPTNPTTLPVHLTPLQAYRVRVLDADTYAQTVALSETARDFCDKVAQLRDTVGAVVNAVDKQVRRCWNAKCKMVYFFCSIASNRAGFKRASVPRGVSHMPCARVCALRHCPNPNPNPKP